MASSGANVLRYTALLTGIGYGYYHQSSITAKTEMAHIERKNEHQASLIAKAKAEWAKKTLPKEVKEGSVISDPNDPKFDLEGYLKLSEAKGGSLA